MIKKKSYALAIFSSVMGILWSLPALAKTEIYNREWKRPVIEKEHGPFYSDSLLGLVLQGGNTIDNTIAFHTTNNLVLESEMLQLGGHYNYGWDEKGLSSRNWDGWFRYQRLVSKNFNPFATIIYEGDPFAGFNERINLDLGISVPIKGKFFSWEMEAGYRYTEELPTQEPERYQNKLRFHLGGKWEIGTSGDVKVWARYLPFLSDTQADLPNYMFDYGASINSFFSENFYLNLSFIGNFRQVPLEDRKQDDFKLIGSIGFKI